MYHRNKDDRDHALRVAIANAQPAESPQQPRHDLQQPPLSIQLSNMHDQSTQQYLSDYFQDQQTYQTLNIDNEIDFNPSSPDGDVDYNGAQSKSNLTMIK